MENGGLVAVSGTNLISSFAFPFVFTAAFRERERERERGREREREREDTTTIKPVTSTEIWKQLIFCKLDASKLIYFFDVL